MKRLSATLLVLLLVGCECDSICEANKATAEFLDKNPSSEQIIDYLNEYKGEAPGAATYGAMVNWGLKNSSKFVETLNHPKVTNRNLDLIVYKIADYGNHSKWCKIYSDLTERENDQYIRSRLLGCNYGL
ncbi:MAG: hypothetical protein HWE27_03820 [Gammaproteobacteria bacterium]|nr:hypothetical protein [Gammaproteobacteria bacterium]